jgi:hypothetical protein
MAHPERFERPTLRFVVLWSTSHRVSSCGRYIAKGGGLLTGFFACSCLVFPDVAAKMIAR